ncbi:flagellar hook-associated protein 1 FlgK [Mobilisporobacter senegalensis]|uniref:Flagellar hook-associated protein 1 n=1 Tax=Mobilisporobacter senegalensis TaxID=1329262 RepID=A0A3N1XY58_9FIRM|nr:flagellar hook-associated protein FlgK [Mobilisporobacter senegalensis]ROR31553.1 flagellar hook-associated protein 1 FlgK [Mobilisporobacter senegalensis]
MGSTFFGLNIGVTGLYTYQAQLNTTGHNIANAGTDGYSRQRAIQKAGQALSVHGTHGMVGTGVNIIDIVQDRDLYYDIKYRNNNAIGGEYSAKYHYTTEIENFFNELTLDGFHKTFNSFFDSLQELSKNVSSLDTRTQANNYALSMAEYFNQLNTNIASIQEEANFEIKNQVDKINSLADQIATVTKQINMIEVSGKHANDLRDQRNLLLDELSQIASISVTETQVGEAFGVNSFVVKLDNHTLVDTDYYNTLQVVPREQKMNMNDIEGLYDIQWTTGQDFNALSQTLGGTLKALIEVRDGNNNENLRGTGVTGSTVVDGDGDFANIAGSKKLIMNNAFVNDINKLNIPGTGVITVGNREYEYVGFTARKDASGNLVYEFDLKDELTKDAVGESVRVGESINYKGIPYYMSKLNEFVRTFAAEFNKVHNTGEDLYGNKGLDYFNGTNIVTGENFILEENPSVFSSYGESYTVVDADGNTLSYRGNYYQITAANFTVTKEVAEDPSRFAASSDVSQGVEGNKVVLDLIALKSKTGMFKQGQPAAFIQTLFDEIGVDTRKAKSFSESQQNILASIANQRLSVSGVDEDEEAMNLVKFQNAYNLSAKVISVMDEVLDKLINEMGV